MAADLSFFERVTDAYKKVRAVASVAMGVLPGGTFRFGSEDVRGVPLRVFKNLPAGLGEYYRTWFSKYADKVWLIYEGERITFAEAERQFDALGAELASAFGVRKGDRVGICMRNYPEFLISFFAITAMGAVAVPLNALWKTEELEYAITDAGCKVIISDPERTERCLPFAGKLGLRFVMARGDPSLRVVRDSGAAMWSQVISSGSSKPVPAYPRMHADDEAMIMYTSGSTGFPKGVVHTQRSVGTAMKIGEMVTYVQPDPNGVKLMAVPLFHITALCPIGLFSVPAGHTIIMMRKWNAGKALDIIEAEKVTSFTGVPTMMRDLMEHPAFSPERVATLKGVVAGGAPVPPSQVSQMRKQAKKVESAQGYGLTETMALGTINKGADYLLHPTSCGRPIPLMVEIAIISPENGKPVPEGERGEVCIKGAMVMKCYNNKEEATRKAIDKNGFFHTGDIGKMEGGFVYILDRMKDLIIRGGENIDCSEVEAALCTHPSVRECSVFGLPDERLGEVVGAAIWIKDTSVPKEDLCAQAAKTLAKFKVPLPINVFIHTNELPKGATGKLDKKGLRAKYSAIVEARSQKAKL